MLGSQTTASWTDSLGDKIILLCTGDDKAAESWGKDLPSDWTVDRIVNPPAGTISALEFYHNERPGQVRLVVMDPSRTSAEAESSPLEVTAWLAEHKHPATLIIVAPGVEPRTTGKIHYCRAEDVTRLVSEISSQL